MTWRAVYYEKCAGDDTRALTETALVNYMLVKRQIESMQDLLDGVNGWRINYYKTRARLALSIAICTDLASYWHARAAAIEAAAERQR